MLFSKRNLIFLAIAILALGSTFWAGLYVGENNRPAIDSVAGLTNKESLKPGEVDFAPFWEAWNLVNDKYVNGNSTSTEAVDAQAKVWGAIGGMVSALGDPYTVFLPPAEKKNFEAEITGNFSGVGMEVGSKDGFLTVVAPLPNTPAKKAGIKPGDKILEIDGKITSEVSVDVAVNMIRGERGSKVVLTVLHQDEEVPVKIAIVRDIIDIPTLDTESRKDGIFVIKLYNFSANSAELFAQAIDKFIASGDKKLILDMRGNPGGFLDAAVDMASWFLPKGKVVVWEHQGGEKEDFAYRSRGYEGVPVGVKMVILVDQGSASASEILAGALSEYKVATLVGQTTFGKGSVQELIPVTKDTSLKVTIARWLTPLGKSISHNGLEPSVKVEITKADVEALRDPQMAKAVELLK